MPPPPAEFRGAYGIRLRGVAHAETMLVDASPDWPAIELVAVIEDPPPLRESVDERRAELTLKTGGRLSIDRDARVARYRIPRRVSDDELVHPYLAPTAAVVSHWAGRLSFHAGGFVAGGGVWALVGEREAGKSSALAWLARTGIDVIADDVLVLEGEHAYTGPRSIDLREETAERFGIGTALGMVGTRPRWRVVLPQMAPTVPFRGWIFLSWGKQIEARVLSARECLPRLLRNLTLRVDAGDPATVLRLATLSSLSFSRPRDWAALEDSMHALLALAEG